MLTVLGADALTAWIALGVAFSQQHGSSVYNVVNRVLVAKHSPIGLTRVPQLNSVRLAARVWGMRGQVLNSEKMLTLSVDLSVTPMPIR